MTATKVFPELLRTGVPVCLNTDDRGMWDSNFTDEYYTAVTQFNVTWEELVRMGRDSLRYSFAEPALKQRMLLDYDNAIQRFEARYDSTGWKEKIAKPKPVFSGYANRQLLPK